MIVEAWIGYIDWIVVGDLGFQLVAIQLEALAIGGGTQFGTQSAGVLPSVLGVPSQRKYCSGILVLA